MTVLSRLVGIALAVAACRPPATPIAIGVTPACRVAYASRNPRERADTIRIVLPETVDPAHAPAAWTEAERLVFGQLYEPLLRQDCAGVLTPGLAERWTRMGDSGWRFRLRPEAKFSDGSAATGSAVAAVLGGFRRVSALGDRELVVYTGGEPLVPAAVADPGLSVTKAAGPGQWPVGTLGLITSAPNGVTLTRAGRVIAFTWPAGADARDALDGGADAVLTDQPAALEYAAARGSFDAIPLPWSRTYVVVIPPNRSVAFAEGGGPWRDAVRGEARPATGPFWWRTVRCNGAERAVPPPVASGSPRVVYRVDDAHARGLAERFVARGASGSPSERRERAVGLSAGELRASIAAGTDYAIIALPRSPGDACASLVRHGLAGRSPQQLIPLLDTRLQLVVRSGRFGVSLDGDGIPRFDP